MAAQVHVGMLLIHCNKILMFKFILWTILESLAQELVEMFVSDLKLKVHPSLHSVFSTSVS
jgi:hypothetical protein